MEKYLVLGMGSPSDMGEFTKEYEGLGGLTPSDYAREHGVKVLPVPEKLSCHNTPERPHPFADDLEDLTGDYDAPNKVVAVLGGGLSLQLPAIVAAHARTVPIIGVPFYSSSTFGGGLDSFTACANLPGGRAILASAPVHFKDRPSLDKAVKIAVFMLTDAENYDVTTVYEDRLEKKGDPAHEVLHMLGMRPYELHHVQSVDDISDHPGMALNITDDVDNMLECDGTFFLAVQSVLPETDLGVEGRMYAFADYVVTLNHTKTTLAVAKPVNAAEFMGRVVGLDDITARRGLEEIFRNKLGVTKPGPKGEPPKYDEIYVRITPESFV